MANREAEETLYLSEQRKFRRLEVTLPVNLAREEDFDKSKESPWTLGYTRDVSMGGSKVYLGQCKQEEEAKWRAAQASGCLCLLRYDVPEVAQEEYVPARVKHTARDKESGNLWLGLEYDDGGEEAKGAALRAGLKTLKARRRWQGAFVLAAVAVVLIGVVLNGYQKRNKALQAQNNALKQEQRTEAYRLSLLSRPSLVGTRAEGIDASFQRKEVQAKIQQLANLNNPSNQASVEQQHQNELQALGISSQPAVTGINTKVGIALPYGYAWPQVSGDLEQLLGRPVPLIVTFQDFSSNFPLADCQLAQKLAKTLQITWEPWSYENPAAYNIKDIAAGKYDHYIDTWAQSARAFGSEVQIRWGHEVNGNWYPWCTSSNGQSTATYIKAFRHIHDRFTQAGAFNVRWVWCINAETVPNVGWNDPLKTYPGDQYVDIISIDGYNFGGSLPHSSWESFQDIFEVPYARVIKKFPNKPLMINEVGCSTVGGDKEAWMRAMDRSLRQVFTKFQAVCWFEANKEADWRMVSSPGTLAAARSIWNQPYYRLGIS